MEEKMDVSIDNLIQDKLSFLRLNHEKMDMDIKEIDNLLLTFLQSTSQSNNLLWFHQCYLKSIEKSRVANKIFDTEFRKFYSSKIFELNPAQVVEIWKLFLEHLDLENYHQMLLFHLFLSHVNISNDQPKWCDLINSTVNALKTDRHQYSLQIYYSLACFKYLSNQPIEIIIPDNDVSTLKINDLSFVFPETNSKYWQKFYDKFYNLNQESQAIFIKLMIFNYKLIKIKFPKQSINNKNLLNEVCVKIIDDEYPLLFLEYTEFLIIELNDCHRSLSFICNNLIDCLVLDDKITTHQIVYRIFNSDKIWESHNFHKVFITVFLKKFSKFFDDSTSNTLIEDKFWLKLQCEIPDINNKKHLNMIQLIQKEFDEISQNISNYDTFDAKSLSAILKLLQIFNKFMPIEYISPFNQIRCVLIYSKFMGKLQCDEMECDSSSSSSYITSNAEMIDLFIKINLRLWSSIRRIWFFDFIKPSQYICMMMKILPLYSNVDCHHLFEKYIITLFKMNDSNKIIQNIKELFEILGSNESEVNFGEYKVKVMSIILKHIYLYEKRSPDFLKLLEISMDDIFELMYENIRLFLKSSNAMNKPSSVFIIEAMIELFNKEEFYKSRWKKIYRKIFKQIFPKDFNINHFNPVNKETLKNFLKFSLENRSKLEDVLPEDFLQKLWLNIIEKFTEVEQSKFNKKIQSKSYWKRVFECKGNFEELQELTTEFFQVPSEHEKQFNECREFINDIEIFLMPIIDFCTVEEFVMILQHCFDYCLQQDFAQATFFIFILSQIVKSPYINKEKAQILNENFVSIIDLSLLLLFLSNKQYALNHNLDNVAFIKGKIMELCRNISQQLMTVDFYSNMHLFSIFNICCEVNIYNCKTIGFYCDLFMIINEILMDLLTKNSFLFMNSLCSGGMDILLTLMISLIRISKDNNLINSTDYEKMKLENCSQYFQQTISKLTNLDEFNSSTLAFHLIGHYLEQCLADGFTISNLVKQNLTNTMFNLIDMIIKRKDSHRQSSSSSTSSMEIFYSRLNDKSKVLLKKLLEHHNQYYRFKGYV